MASDLRRRSPADRADESAPVVPIDTNEQDRIIAAFLVDKLAQDRLWKHFASVLYGFSALLLAGIAACSILFGCGARTESPLDGPRCQYFSLPTLLFELIDDDRAYVGSKPLVVHLVLLFALAVVVTWAFYSHQLNEHHMQQSFNESRAARQTAKQGTAARREETKDEQELAALTGSSSAVAAIAPALPISPSQWQQLRAVQRVANVLLSIWLLLVVAVLSLRSLGVLTSLFFFGPALLAGLTKIAAKWSADLEAQIADLKASKYTYHEL